MRRPSWRPSDPGRFALRAALRTGIVLPLAFAAGMATGSNDTAMFAAFGAIAILMFADFGGPLAVRIAAYASLSAVGMALIALGTLCSTHEIAATVAMALVGFAILFAGVVNGYVAAASSATLLLFILPVMVPGESGDIGARMLGWAIACALAVPAVLLLFGARPRDRLRSGAAAACRALAELLGHPSPTRRDAEPAIAAIDELHARFVATPHRPGGPTGATGALVQLIDELDWLKALTLAIPPLALPLDPTPAERALREASAAALAASAVLIEGHARELPDLDAIEQGRGQVVDEVLVQLADPAVRDDDARLWATIVRAWEARVVSYITRDIAQLALVAGGAAAPGSEPRWLRFVRRQGVALAASGHVAAAHAGVRSIWFRNSVRGATGLALAVLVAQLTSVQHAFWVVFGTLSVLRSSALGTGSTILQALAGTVAGIAVGAPLLLVVGDDETALWCALPIASMVAAYAPRAISFAAGQAGFTVAVFVVFNLIQPSGWEVGLVRIEDVSIGFLISLGVGLLFWPRGAAALLRATLAEALSSGGRFVAAAFARLATGTSAQSAELRLAARAAQDRVDAAFRQRLAERSGQDIRLVPHASLLTAAARLGIVGDAALYLADRLGAAPRPATADRLAADARDLGGWYERLGASLAQRSPAPAVAPLDPQAHAALCDGVREAIAAGDRDAAEAALVLTWAGLHVDQLGRLEERAAQAAAGLSLPA